MAGSDISTGLGFGILAPASALPRTEGEPGHEHGEGKSRKNPRRDRESNDELVELEPADDSAHQLDRMA